MIKPCEDCANEGRMCDDCKYASASSMNCYISKSLLPEKDFIDMDYIHERNRQKCEAEGEYSDQQSLRFWFNGE